jgi:hypothetical protein
VIQCGGSPRLALEAAEGLRIASNFVWEELQRDKTVQPCVLSLVDHTHPATAELLDDPIVRDGPAD